MAQAARLSLRMQKEVKLLLTDPPHGCSFPSLSDISSSLDAQIEGPEGTVYGGGVFRIKIQIPERYPFQPPSVTFATPIYHPNIDNGGRICLDILNLPPKGGWQPSLNISTVLTSIRLLLDEPNPDDGLMCEASKEFKYDRQAFDRKAKFMTEKYAMTGLSFNSVDGHSRSGESHSMQHDSVLISMENDENGKKSHDELKDNESTHKKFVGISRKLSLASPSTMTKEDGRVGYPSLAVSFLENHVDKNLMRGDQRCGRDEYVLGKPGGMQQKSSSESSSEFTKDLAHGEKNASSYKNPIDSLSRSKIEESSPTKHKKLSLGLKCSFPTFGMESKENLDPHVLGKNDPIGQKALSEAAKVGDGPIFVCGEVCTGPKNHHNPVKVNCGKGLEKYNQVSAVDAREHASEEVGDSPLTDAVVVLDSEDSEEEADGSSLAKPLVGQKRLANLRLKTRRVK